MALKPGQIKCINTLDEPLVVAAGAGSGKTFTLTKRIVHALESGYVQDIDQILAITFTKKAAGELKSRIKSSLAAAGMMEQALKVDEAWIATIHGMCARMLRSHALELGIDPLFKVGDAAVLNEYLSDAINRALKEMELTHPQQLASLFVAYPAQTTGFGESVEGMVRQVVNQLSAEYDGEGALRLPGETEDATRSVAHALESVEALRALVAVQKAGERQAGALAALDEAASSLREALECAPVSPEQALSLFEGIPSSYGFGNADFKNAAKELVASLQKDAIRMRLLMSRKHLETIVVLARRAFELFAERKEQEGIVDNNDLLVRASRAIAQHESIAAQYKDKFSIVMVDEFQDTDQMQVDMIKQLAGEGAQRLCTVGDAQQSIYRFRGADVSVYRRHLNDVARADADHVIKLPDNFRSHADVLSFVDRIFERSDMFGGEFMSLRCSRSEESASHPFRGCGPRIIVQHTSYAKRGATQLLRRIAAQRIARQFAAYVRAGHSASDMVLLLGVTTNAALYARAIRDEGLACVIAGGSVLNTSPEAGALAALVRFLANPHQTQDLFTVLSSPLFNCSASDFVELASEYDEGDGRWHRRALDRGLFDIARACADGEAERAFSPQLENAVSVLRAALREVGRRPIAALVNEVVLESGLLSRLQSEGGEGQAHAANVYKLVRMLDELERSDYLGPSVLAERFQHTLELSTEAPGALSATGGNFVRIMTVHASKGLEFPIVAVAEMKKGGGDGARFLCDAVDGSVYLSLEGSARMQDRPGVAGAPFSVVDALVDEDLDEEDLAKLVAQEADPLMQRAYLRARNVRGDREEAKRLLYVALTRAKEAIIVSTVGNASRGNPQGAPDNVFGSIGPALTGSDDWFEPGVTFFEFGGSQPARVEHVRVEEDGSCTQLEPGASEGANVAGVDGSCKLRAGEEGGNGLSTEPPRFMVPASTVERYRVDGVFRPRPRDVFSYSSVSDSSHEGDLLDRLAAMYWVSCVGISEGGAEDAACGVFDDPTDVARMVDRNYAALIDEGDEASWAYLDREPADTDKATDLGIAFHRLAEYAVHVRDPLGELRMPPDERLQALMRICGLGHQQKVRLAHALNRWFNSDVAREMAMHERLLAEVPFFVDVRTECADSLEDGAQAGEAAVHLEGEIDLLAYDEQGSAFVVDYKTGGREDETVAVVRRKHVLQAACYAYALLRQGVPAVEATFVRVEQPAVDNFESPQLVRYRFEADSLPLLEGALAQAYRRAQE